MSRYREIENIVNDAFSKQFKGWEKMSKLDPIKVISEALSQSLVGLERQQQELFKDVVDSLPSVLSFASKKAKAPAYQFAYTPQKNRPIERSLKKGTRLSFSHLGKDYELHIVEDTEPFTFENLQVTQENQEVLFTFKTESKIKDLPISFIAGQSIAPVCHLDRIEIIESREKAPKALGSVSIPSTFDSTRNFTTSGVLRIPFPETLTDSEGQRHITVRLSFRGTLPKGTFLLSVLKAETVEKLPELHLGELKGRPWENVSLPTRLESPPSQLILKFPNEETQMIERVDTDLLKIKHLDPSRYLHAFFYNPSSHALVIPCAHQLASGFGAGIELLARNAKLLPEMPLETGHVIKLDRNPTKLEELRVVHQSQHSTPRESSESYMTRFYSQLRQPNQRPTRDLNLFRKEVEAELLAASQDIRCVELSIDSAAKTIGVYILTGSPEISAELSLSAETKDLVDSILSSKIPIDYEWLIKPFFHTELSIETSLEVELSSGRLGILTQEMLVRRISTYLRSYLLPPPFGSVSDGSPFKQKTIFSALRTYLKASRVDNSHLREDEVIGLHGHIVHGATSEFLEHINREPGEIFNVIPTVTVEIGNDELLAISRAERESYV